MWEDIAAVVVQCAKGLLPPVYEYRHGILVRATASSRPPGAPGADWFIQYRTYRSKAVVRDRAVLLKACSSSDGDDDFFETSFDPLPCCLRRGSSSPLLQQLLQPAVSPLIAMLGTTTSTRILVRVLDDCRIRSSRVQVPVRVRIYFPVSRRSKPYGHEC